MSVDAVVAKEIITRIDAAGTYQDPENLDGLERGVDVYAGDELREQGDLVSNSLVLVSLDGSDAEITTGGRVSYWEADVSVGIYAALDEDRRKLVSMVADLATGFGKDRPQIPHPDGSDNKVDAWVKLTIDSIANEWSQKDADLLTFTSEINMRIITRNNPRD